MTSVRSDSVSAPNRRRFFSVITKRHTDDTHSILQTKGKALPLTQRERHKTPPTWTLSNSQLAKRPPIVKIDTVSMHILENQGRGANCLVTVRKLDQESSKFSQSLEARSRSGVVGRIFDGVWTKLLQVSLVDIGVCIVICFVFSCASSVLQLSMLVNICF
jgi:hypothetical protein